MFSNAALFSLVALAVSAVAVPNQPQYSCNSGTLQCCNQLADSQSASGAALLGSLLGAAAQGITGQFGVQCNPIGGIAVQGNSCATQPVCCDDNKINGLVAVGCIPANVNV
ncbi:putative hydrophobins [Lyophyllum shimeji]|uniref:Hydrophobin n=1 Tax=Lyophyllum shimeji TaxID=47721 RepID=A0A9P3PSY8_LYOSH|nr:putative hydrophobins [Lyophyllum shimeji]